MAAPQVVVVGGGFSGFFAARTLERVLPPRTAEVILVSEADHLCYSPLLPEVAAGRLEARRIAVPLRAGLRRARILQGTVYAVDFEQRTMRIDCATDQSLVLPWDRLILAVGSVTRNGPRTAPNARVFTLKTLVEAQDLHDHELRQLEIADAIVDPQERRARLTFVAVGAGYTGTEAAAQLQCMTLRLAKRFSRISPQDLTWYLLDVNDRVLPELGPRLARSAMKVIRRRGMRVRLGTTIAAVGPGTASLSDGTSLGTFTVLWTVGVTPPPLVQQLGLSVSRGRLRVDDTLQIRPGVWAAGDTAALNDPFSRAGHSYPPTAQHAQRQGVLIARNVAASLGHGRTRAYRHRDLGLVADLGGAAAVAKPLGLPLTGLSAKVIAKAYHLYALPCTANRVRVATDWLLNLVSAPIAVQLIAPRTKPNATAPSHRTDHRVASTSE
jgi:NADH dehydrogenase